jgi:hypothetical protein
VALYLCFKFHIFNRPILEEYVFQIERGPHLFQSCLHATQDGLPLVVREMHPSFESFVVTDTLGVQTSLIDIHHHTLFRFISKDDSISSTSKTYICFCLGKGEGLWLVARPSICLFRITQSIFTSTLRFHLNLIQSSASSFFTCECGHKLDAFGMHLVRCPFGGQ